jgi:endonuclease/exonuclease/phosphatase family metal-dependent hydrolase
VIYRPDRSQSSFYDEFANLLVHHACSPAKVLILGDFNIHWDVPDDPDTRKLKSVLQEAAFHQHVTWPTHIAGHTIDFVIVLYVKGQ